MAIYGFVPEIIELADQTAFSYVNTAAALDVTIGTALTYSSGDLALAAGATKPTNFSMMITASTAGKRVPMTTLRKDIIYKTTNSAAFASIVPGSLVTISADGNQVTATTTNGVARVVRFDPRAVTATGHDVYVRFD